MSGLLCKLLAHGSHVFVSWCPQGCAYQTCHPVVRKNNAMLPAQVQIDCGLDLDFYDDRCNSCDNT
jgi:hypothetical protein